jgi:hypothetical protein
LIVSRRRAPTTLYTFPEADPGSPQESAWYGFRPHTRGMARSQPEARNLAFN